MATYLALDLGAESGRLMAVDIGETISTNEIHRFETPVTTDLRNRRCWDFPKLISEIKVALSKAAQIPGAKYESIAVDTWGLDFGFLDVNQKIIDLPVSHRDHRTDGFLAKAADLVGKKRLHEASGAQLLEVNSIYQLLAIKELSPDEFERAAHLLLMPDLILHALTGVIKSEYTIATTSGLYDVVSNKWALDLALELGIPTNFFGEVQDAGSIRGNLLSEIAAETGIGELVCIATASHDTAAAVVATPFTAPGNAYISSGTWSLMGIELPKPLINEITLERRLTNEGGFGRNIRLLRNIMGLWVIQEVRRDLKKQGIELTYAELVDAAKAQADPYRTLIYIDDPLFHHAGGMIERIQSYAKNSKQPKPNSPGELAQCVFVSLALQYSRIADVLQKCGDEEMKAIQIVGGGSQNEHLSQMTADISGIEVITGPVEATAMGNAIVQAIGLGQLAGLDAGRELVRKSVSIKRYAPTQDLELRAHIKSIRLRYDQLIDREL